MRHRIRATVTDVHHTLLPLTGRVRPDPDALIRDAVAVDLHGHSALVPSPEDLVVHAAAHLFQDGDLGERLRDLLDMHQMLTEFASADGFWDRLTARANLHQCGRPLFYAVSFAQSMLGTAVPETIWPRLERRPGPVARGVMQVLVPPALVPSHPDHAGMGAATARWLLFVRSHWLRMPPLLLARHLATKAWKSLLLKIRR